MLIADRSASKTKLLDAALSVIRTKGYGATRVEDVCAAANLTKGSFFHFFRSKEDLALAAAAYWGERAEAVFGNADFRTLPDPRSRLLAYVDLRKAMIAGEIPEFSCLAGTLIGEVYATAPSIRDACEQTIGRHCETLEADIAAAMRDAHVDGAWTARSLALYTQAVIQGAFILAKATDDPAVAVDCLDHLHRHLELLFPQ